MARPRKRTAAVLAALVAAAGVATACGEKSIDLDEGATANIENGAELFNERCAGCHTLSAAGAEGSAARVNDQERTDGPNFDQRAETVDQVLYAIGNGGFSGAIMPQNIVVGQEARDVAEFVAKYSGSQVQDGQGPAAPQDQGS